jgi:cytochrome c-type biogenesis protein CcmH/NrfG
MSEQISGSNPEARPADDWQPCAAGEVSNMVLRVQRRRRNVTVVRAASVVACLLVAGLLLQFQSIDAARRMPGGITCGKALQHQEEYQAGELEGQKLSEQIRNHLADCPRCAEKFQSRPGTPQASESIPVERTVAGSALLGSRLAGSGF